MQLLELKNRLEKWRSQQLSELEDKQNALVADKVKKEENKHQLEMDLQRKLKALQTEYNRQVKQETQTFEVFANDIQAQIEEKQNQVDARKQELLKAQRDELHGKGMDTQTLDAYNKRIAELDAELAFIRKNRDVVAVYRNDKIELFDQETSVRQKRKNKAEALMAIEDKFWQRSERLKLQLSVAQSQLTKQQTALKKLDAGLNAVRSFRRDETLCPLESNEIEEKITTKDCLSIVEELKRQIYEDGVGLLCPHLFDVAGQHGNAAHQFFVHLLCQKVSVQIIGVEDGDLFGVFHGAFLPVWVGGGQPMASCRAK